MIALALSLALAAPPPTAVMPLVGGDAISNRAAGSLTDTLAVELQKQGGMVVILPRVVATVLSPLQPRHEVGCTTDPCMADVTAAFGAERFVTGEASWDGGKLVLNLRMLEARSARVLTMVERAYKKGTLNDLLGGLPEMVSELLRAPAPASAAPKPAVAVADPAKPADAPRSAAPAAPGTFVLHYHRRDGRYGLAGLYTWESAHSGVDLRKPMRAPESHSLSVRPVTRAPDGRDEFGVYWVVQTDRFRNGRVNFVVQGAADSRFPWDECGSAGQFWIFADGPEAWMNVPECELFATQDEARRDQRK